MVETINQIDIGSDGLLRWGEDGVLLDQCEDCGTQGYSDRHCPDRVWDQFSMKSRFVCWPCFILRVLRHV